ncbi:MAG: phosphodiesterase [Anaeroplasmataceae bacterium]
MKYLIFSDLHGSVKYANLVISKFKQFKADKMICLGDILYNGPRNDVLLDYNPKEVVDVLNKYKDHIVAIKGNCDALVDEMVLEFKLNDNLLLDYNQKNILLVHGHQLESEMVEKFEGIVISGHTHVYTSYNLNNKHYLNPGSTTMPKNHTTNSYAIMENDSFVVYDFNDNELLNVKI